jgi:glycosyltransferase involved in cell wall biosynthesis
MRPLRVALVHRDSPRCIDRMVGPWSYAVPEFRWTHVPVGKTFRLDKDELAARGFDVIVHEDAKCWGEFTGSAKIPVCYVVMDSTLSGDHYQHRLTQAKQADLILVDWDDLSRFESVGVPVRRCGYSVNDHFFRDWSEEKTVDVAYHATTKGSPERVALADWLESFCERRGYVYQCGRRIGPDYALAFNRAWIVVDLARTPTTRNHRALDAMASWTCLVSSPLPEVSGEEFVEGVHYEAWRDYDELGAKIDRLLVNSQCRRIAEAAYGLVRERHTWSVRAAELKSVLEEEFPHLVEVRP